MTQDELNTKSINYLLNAETDLISSSNLAPLKEIKIINLLSNNFNYINTEIFDREKDFIEFSIIEEGISLTFDQINNRIGLLETFNFIITRTEGLDEKIKIIKKYAPMAQVIIL